MRTKSFIHNILGFSALEVTITMIILSLCAALTLPRLPAAMENQNVQVAKKVLYEIYTAQKRFFLDNESYASSLSALDVPSIKYPPAYDLTVQDNATQLALLANTSKGYTLSVNSSGEISCSGDGCGSFTTSSLTASETGAHGTTYTPPE